MTILHERHRIGTHYTKEVTTASAFSSNAVFSYEIIDLEYIAASSLCRFVLIMTRQLNMYVGS